MLRRCWLALLFAAVPSLIFHSARPALAQEQAQPAAEEPAAEGDLEKMFVVPEGDDVAALAKFLRRIAEFQPATREEALMHRKKSPLAKSKAADKILALEKDKKSAAYRLAQRTKLDSQATEVVGDEATDAQRKAFLKELTDYIAAGDKSGGDAELALNFAMNLEYLPARELAAEAYANLGELLADSKDPQAARYGKMLVGAGRRLNLVGKVLDLKGTTVDGKPFDLAALRGKVTLVDFWATWCGPCLAEIPNIKKNYEKYHDRGFEVVGVSIDQDRETLEEFLADKPFPWSTLHDKENEGRHPATSELGIFAIPCVILVDKEGKVVSLHARGAELGTRLEELLGSEEKGSEEKGSVEKK